MSDKIDVINKNGQKVEKSGLTEKLFFLDMFYRRNKKKIIFSAVVLVIGGISYLANSYIKDYKLDKANTAYYNYSKGIEVEENLKQIQKCNPKLFSLIQFSEAMKNSDMKTLEEFTKNESQILSDLADYQLSSLKRDVKKLNSYSYKDRAIFRDLAILSEAYSLIEEGEMEEAQNRLSFISDTSSIKEVAKYLNHFGAVPTYYDSSTNQYIRDDLNKNGIVTK